ncbi:MAG: phage protein Gp36 family protein, partial [Limisphaerales bacterium]
GAGGISHGERVGGHGDTERTERDMAWRSLTAEDVLTRLAGVELEAYRTAARADGQVDPLTEILAGVVAEVRSRIAAGSGNQLGAEGTVPDAVRHHGLAMVRFRLITRLPLRVAEDRRKEYEDALAFLDQVAEGTRQQSR